MKTTKKLSLNKETIAHLNRTEGRTVVGGAVRLSDATDCKACPATGNCTKATWCNQNTCYCPTGLQVATCRLTYCAC